MRKQKLKARIKRKYVPRTTDSDHGHRISANVLDRQFDCKLPNTRWVCDITYIPTGEGWMYLAAVMDLCSRKIVGWSMRDHMEATLAIDALTMAIDRRRPGVGLLHHSDRGVQYACDDYRKVLDTANMSLSMSSKGDCWDNAAMESFWSTLKTELVHHEHYATREVLCLSRNDTPLSQ
jgi:transposase InsO family protein